MDYKSTLNLPRTDFPMKADLVAREPQRLEKWEREKIYAQIQAARKGAPKFVLHDGPPFANGDVHVGTALNKILKDIIVKYKTLRGYDAPYVPGWDCHGLPIEFKVSQEMRKGGTTSTSSLNKKDGDAVERVPPGPATIRTACDAYARKYIGIQREQFKRLGIFGDWENPYLTLNKEYEADELRLFADIVGKGFVYRGKKPVYWSIPCRTALAEAEVEYQDHVSQSIYVKFRVKGEPNTFVLIWTTTPWTLPANLAVAFNTKLFYSIVQANGEAYIVCNSLLEEIAKKSGWSDHQIVRTIDAEELGRLEYEHPFCARTGKLLVGDEFVTSDTGTGFVHIAPGHGMEDYLLGLRVGLPIYSPVNDDGCFTHTGDLPVAQQMPAEMVGKSILEKHGKSDANEAVLHELRVRGALLHQENYHHSYPHCWRSKTPIIFRAMDQWFIKIDHVRGNAGVSPASFGVPPNESPQQSSTRDASNSRPEAGAPQAFRQVALDEINRVRWIPDWGKGRIEAAVKGRPDWCISRQRSWGVPIPFFYDSQGNPLPDPAKEPELSAQVVRKAADLIEQQSSNVWFEKSAAELWAHCKPSGWTGPEAVAKSNDTLDVWIDSGSSSRAVLMRRSELHHATGGPGSTPAPSNQGASGTAPSQDWVSDIYLEGSDQHRGWFQSSLLLSLAGNGAAPFKTVLTHGFMVDEDRQKVSKSKQGQAVYEKPQTADRYVQEFGADVLRLWVASQDYRSDIVVSEERIKKVGETYRVIRNALRYQLSNLYDFDPAKHTVPDDQLTGLDRWILGEFAKLEADVAAAYDAYEFHVVYQKISQFAAVELSAIYHDVVKDRLYTDAANSARRRSTQTALHRMVTSLCQMLAPILAFTTEEAWEFVPGKSAENVHAAVWKPMSFTVSEAERQCWAAWMRLRELAFAPIEAERKKGVIGKNLESKIQIWGSWDSLAVGAQHRSELQELLNVSQLTVELTPALDGEVKIQYQVIKASGQKCERCWHWETNVGTHAEHPTLCARCVEAVKENSGA